MASKTVHVGAPAGLHARPAKLIADTASRFDDQVTLQLADNEPVDAASPLMIMTLGAEGGAEITVASDNEIAVEEVAAIVESEG